MTVSLRSITDLRNVFADADPKRCPFTPAELAELDDTDEMLVYVPAHRTAAELAEIADVRTNICFVNDQLIRNVMVGENHWFVTSRSSRPELLYHSATAAGRAFEDEGLHGMDLRRYLAFVAVYRQRFGSLPDQTYWSFLLSSRYDRSGVSIAGFDAHGVLNHHGWMRSFKAKFVGSRYVVLPPRIEVTPETAALSRAYRGRRDRAGHEAAMD